MLERITRFWQYAKMWHPDGSIMLELAPDDGAMLEIGMPNGGTSLKLALYCGLMLKSNVRLRARPKTSAQWCNVKIRASMA